MKILCISIILTILPLSSKAQNDAIMIQDSMEVMKNQVQEMKHLLAYGDDVLCVMDDNDDLKCELVKAHFDTCFLYIELKFTLNKSNKSRMTFRRSNGTENMGNFCILDDRYIRAEFEDSMEEMYVDLQKDIPVIKTFKFNIYEQEYPIKPRLVEYLKITEKDSNQEFVFRNIPIDYDEDK